ncbi:hypothetical protein HYU18_01325 [Candidatus Woesearchaeota archaeon]|nr:hypothetical protein [Candidatus Woesearchaeota archaeon]
MTTLDDQVAAKRGLTELSTPQFLKAVRSLFPISYIYYPGACYDDTLESAFYRWQIAYLDYYDEEDEREDLADFARGRNYITGDYTQPPFRPGTFDAVFFNDPDAGLAEALQIFQLLKVGGILIFVKKNECQLNISESDIGLYFQFSRLELPFRHKDDLISVYQKRHPAQL